MTLAHDLTAQPVDLPAAPRDGRGRHRKPGLFGRELAALHRDIRIAKLVWALATGSAGAAALLALVTR